MFGFGFHSEQQRVFIYIFYADELFALFILDLLEGMFFKYIFSVSRVEKYGFDLDTY